MRTELSCSPSRLVPVHRFYGRIAVSEEAHESETLAAIADNRDGLSHMLIALSTFL